MKLKLYSNLLNKSWLLDVKDAGSTMNYYKFDINLPDNIDDGQYNYELIDDNDNIIDTGIIQVGDFTQNNKQYNNKKENIVYNG